MIPSDLPPAPVPDHIGNSFRLAMRRVAQTIAILSMGGTKRDGMTLSSLTSVSLTPPTILFCVNQQAHMAARLQIGQSICLNILADDQAGLSRLFADATTRDDRFQPELWHIDGDGTPWLGCAAVNIFARIIDSIPAATHNIILCTVTAAQTDPLRTPLVYHDGQYHGLIEIT